MNRFTKDMTIIDDMLPLVLFDLIQVSDNVKEYLPSHFTGVILTCYLCTTHSHDKHSIPAQIKKNNNFRVYCSCTYRGPSVFDAF